MITTFAKLAQSNAKLFFIAKKGQKYLTIVNNELRLTETRDKAIASKSSKSIENLIQNASIDDRNAKVLGRSVNVVTINRK